MSGLSLRSLVLNLSFQPVPDDYKHRPGTVAPDPVPAISFENTNDIATDVPRFWLED